MIFWIMTALTVAAMIVAGIVVSKVRYNADAEDVAMVVFFTWLVAFVVSWIVIGIAAANLSVGNKAEFQQVGKWEYRIADGTTAEIDQEDGEFEFYVNENGVLREKEIYGTNVTTISGGDGKSVTIVDQRQELGTGVFPWGQSNSTRTITVK